MLAQTIALVHPGVASRQYTFTVTAYDLLGVLTIIHTRPSQSDYKGVRKRLNDFPAAKHLLVDRSYNADWFRDGLLEKEITPCIPPKKNRKRQITCNKTLYKQRYKVENLFGILKDWCRILT